MDSGEYRDNLIAMDHLRWLRHNSAEAHHQCDFCTLYEQRYWCRDVEMTDHELRLVSDFD